MHFLITLDHTQFNFDGSDLTGITINPINLVKTFITPIIHIFLLYLGIFLSILQCLIMKFEDFTFDF